MTAKRIFNLFITFAVMMAALFVSAPNPVSAEVSAANVNLDQWANAPSNAWQNGNLNGTNSTFSEGDVVPFRLAIEGLTPGQHTILINYDFTAGGHEAYDFLATYDSTETGVDICAAGGGGVSSMCPALPAPDTEAFPSDTFQPLGDTAAGLTVAGAEALFDATHPSGRNLTIWGGSVVSISGPTHVGLTTGNSTAEFLVTFDTGTCLAEPCAVLLAWGGHLAQSAYWRTTTNDPNGAGMITGAPFHMRTLSLDGGGASNQDRSIQPGALQTYLELIKDLTAEQEPGASGLFDLFIQEAALTADTIATGVGDYQSGPLAYDISGLTPFTFYEEGNGTTDLAWYWIRIVCRDRTTDTLIGQTPFNMSIPTLTINIVPGQDVVCTITNADIPTAVTLLSTSAEAGDGQVTVRWETSFEELGTFGFKILRSDTAYAAPTLESAMLPAQGYGGLGASYEYVDKTVLAGKTYFYWIQVIDGADNFAEGPLEATVNYFMRLPAIFR